MIFSQARVAKLADALALGASGSNPVGVRPSPRAQFISTQSSAVWFLLFGGLGDE